MTLIALVVFNLTALAGSFAHTWHSCQHSVANYGSSAFTSAQSWKYCYTIGVRLKIRNANGSVVTLGWNTSTSSEKRILYAYRPAGATILSSQHFVRDGFGVDETHTCTTAGCVSGLR